MGGIWNYDFRSLAFAFFFKISLGYQSSREFAMRSGGGLKSHGVHAAYFTKDFFRVIKHFKRALRAGVHGKRVEIGKTFKH